ncbi:Brevican core protein, partial [Plakobranchus ocellatus]
VECVVEPPASNVNTSETRTRIPALETVTYGCEEGHVPVAGDALRACSVSGALTGRALQCAEPCPAGWSFYQPELACYRWSETKKTFADAEADCATYNGTLATAKNAEEKDFVESLRGTDWIWIGLNDIRTENNFVWSDGTPTLWSNWRSGQPDNWRNEDCVMAFHGSGVWNDLSCYYSLQYVCKYPLTATWGPPNTPSTTPSAQSTPSTPSTPGTTNAPRTPSTTNAPSTSETTSAPSTPGTTNAPRTPGTTNAPNTPSTTNAPSTPSTTNAPGTPGTTTASITPSTTNAPACPAGWSFYQPELACYRWSETKKTFADAEADCATYNGTLTTEKNAEEKDFVESLR